MTQQILVAAAIKYIDPHSGEIASEVAFYYPRAAQFVPLLQVLELLTSQTIQVILMFAFGGKIRHICKKGTVAEERNGIIIV